ncbi:MAG: hypothetical protein EA384_03980 [Spirochaetaceae bacterium]|nr:MAG: hypothetical protein EA384_03980 [Spirochaetaceae bacterium]
MNQNQYRHRFTAPGVPQYGGDSAHVRASAYALLSSLYQDQPDVSAVDRFSSLWRNFDNALSGNCLGRRTLLTGSQFCAAWQSSDSRVSLQLRREFALLFLSPRGVQPYESVYRGTRRRLMDDPWLQVREFYRKAGMQKGQRELHPEDHASVELGFMAYLAFMDSQCSAAAGKEEIRTEVAGTQLQFLEEHLIGWIPQLCRRIEAVPEAPYYHRVARFTSALIEEDHERLVVSAKHTYSTCKGSSL